MLTKKIVSRDSDPDYRKARTILERQDQAAKLVLAENRSAQPEVLYYLASDSSAHVRKLIARNPSAPRHADHLLAHDSNDDVRSELARKIARLLPDMSPDEQSVIRDKTLEILEILALDQLPRVRAILSEGLKCATNVPKHIVLKLAHDLESIISAPILEYSPLLADEDLKEIIAATHAKDAIPAIARRRNISESVSDAIAASLDIPAVAALLANPKAQIREETLDMIVEQAEKYHQLQEPLVSRPNLSVRTMRRLACFVAASLVSIMIEHNHLEEGEAQNLLTQARERIQSEPIGQDDTDNIAKTIASLHAKGAIDDDFIQDAVVNKKREAITHALALLSGLSVKDIHKITSERDGKKITALSWKAGLSMRTAYLLQTGFAFVPPGRIINARNGVDYPLTPNQMTALMENY
jgi:uncharacterized protein (DUF2336 family)